MTHRRARVARGLVASRPHEVWNAFVSVLSDDPRGMSSLEQRAAALVFRYESEVQNGGHLQYLSNRGVAEAREAVAALDQVGAPQHAELLKDVLASLPAELSQERILVEEYVSIALEDPYGDHDRASYEMEPLDAILKRYLAANLDAFIEFHEGGA